MMASILALCGFVDSFCFVSALSSLQHLFDLGTLGMFNRPQEFVYAVTNIFRSCLKAD